MLYRLSKENRDNPNWKSWFVISGMEPNQTFKINAHPTESDRCIGWGGNVFLLSSLEPAVDFEEITLESFL